MSTIELFSHNQDDWKTELRQSLRSRQALFDYLGVPDPEKESLDLTSISFPTLIPRPWADRIDASNPDDPLLRQVLTSKQELIHSEELSNDPLEEKAFNSTKGLVKKYANRALIIATPGCAINCRYCFRRHFPYQDNRLSRQDRQKIVEQIAADNAVEEVILSGGDPLLLDDITLKHWLESIFAIPHVKAVRIHTRLPIAIPQRITPELVNILSSALGLVTLVHHINHANEVSEAFIREHQKLSNSNIKALNQSVLLAGVNDSVTNLKELSWALAKAGIHPYYLHLPDPIQNTEHFLVTESDAKNLHIKLQQQLPGHLVPILVQEVAFEEHKTRL